MSPEHDRSEENRTLVAEYVLGVLSAEEHRRIERLIESNTALQAERDFWITHFSGLNEQFAETPAPANILPRLEQRLFGTTKPQNTLWNNVLFWRGIAAGALAIAVMAIGINLVRPTVEPLPVQPAQFVAMLEEAGSDLRMIAYYGGDDELRLTALGGEQVADKDYELWVIEGDNAPVSMGLITTNAANLVTVSADTVAAWDDGAILAVTLEPAGGAPGGVPTGPIVAKGNLVRI